MQNLARTESTFDKKQFVVYQLRFIDPPAQHRCRWEGLLKRNLLSQFEKHFGTQWRKIVASRHRWIRNFCRCCVETISVAVSLILNTISSQCFYIIHNYQIKISFHRNVKNQVDLNYITKCYCYKCMYFLIASFHTWVKNDAQFRCSSHHSSCTAHHWG